MFSYQEISRRIILNSDEITHLWGFAYSLVFHSGVEVFYILLKISGNYLISLGISFIQVL